MAEKVCLHENVDKEVLMGQRTGDRICRDCGEIFLSAEEVAKARAEARAKLKTQPPTEAS